MAFRLSQGFKVWASDRQSMIFSYGASYETSDLYRMRPDGSDVQRLSHTEDQEDHVSLLTALDLAWWPGLLAMVEVAWQSSA